MNTNKTGKPTISFIDKIESPRLYYTDKVADEINYLVDKCKQEVGWLGLMEQIEDTNAYLVTEIFVPEQKVHGAETDILPEALLELHNGLEEAGKDPNQLRYWGHSHVNMSTGPSGQDIKQVMEYRDGGIEFFVMAIYNKKGENNVEFFDFDSGLRHQGIWNGRIRAGLDEEEKKSLDEVIQSNVKSFHSGYVNNYPNNYHGNHKNRNHPHNNHHTNQGNHKTIPLIEQTGGKKNNTEGKKGGGGNSQQTKTKGKNETLAGQKTEVKVYGNSNQVEATKELMWNELDGFYEQVISEAGAQ